MLNELEAALGYTYHDRTLLHTALSHTSYANETYQDSLHSYERLEFLGDSILGFLTADYLYRTFPDKQEGELTRIRAEMVCEQNLAEIAERLSVGRYLLLGNGEDQGGGRHRSGILCDVMEAIIAAAYLDGGLDAAKGIVMRHVIATLPALSQTHDYKTELQELVQRSKHQNLTYELVGTSGPDHQKEFSVRVLLNGVIIGHGSGSSKKRAEQMAAGQAIRRLSEET